jgi:hypothetical protein
MKYTEGEQERVASGMLGQGILAAKKARPISRPGLGAHIELTAGFGQLGPGP